MATKRNQYSNAQENFSLRITEKTFLNIDSNKDTSEIEFAVKCVGSTIDISFKLLMQFAAHIQCSL